MNNGRTLSPMPIRWISRALLAAAFILLLFHLIVYVAYAVNLMQFPFDYDQGEGFELVDTILFSQGEWPYRDTDIFPFYSSNYPPLFHVLAAPFVSLFGPAYWYGRLLGFVATCITAGAIALAVYREEQHRTVAILSGLAFLASNTVYHIGPLFRQHMTMVMFEMLAVLMLAHANETEDVGRRRRRIAAGLALVLAAGYTKQLALATAVAVFVFLFIRQPRRAVIWGVIFALVGGGIFLWMNIATDGQWFLQAITANVNDYYPDQTVGLYRLWFHLHGALIIPALLYAAYELYFSRLSIYTVWFAASVINSALAGKWGAGDSYFATAIAATCVLSGIFAARTLRGTWRFSRNYLSPLLDLFHPLARPMVIASAAIIPVLYLAYGWATLKMPTNGVFAPIAQLLNLQPNADNGFYDSAGRIVGGYADIGHFTTADDIAAGYRIVDLVGAENGLVLSEEAAFNLLAGKAVITNPTQLLNLWLSGYWDETELVGLIDEHAFSMIILRAQFFPDPVLRAIARGYEQTESIHMNGFDYLILRPRAVPQTETPS